MKFTVFYLTVAIALLAIGCGTSSTTATGPSVDRCGVIVTTSISSVGASGGNGRLAVAAGRECTWSVTSNVPWITPRPPFGGQGDGSVDYGVAANLSPDARRGTLSVNGRVVELMQEGVACQFELRPASQNMDAERGSGSFTVEAPSGCTWTPAVSHDWITLTNDGSRTGSGSVDFSVARNAGDRRDGTIGVGSQAFTIQQSAPSCRYQLSPIPASFGGEGGSGTVTITAARTCAWTASTNVLWIALAGSTSGNGDGTVSFTVQPNTGVTRNGVLTIAGQRFTVTQLQAACNYSITPAGQTFNAGGGQSTVSVTTGSTCTWNTSEVPSWVTGMPTSGTGSQAVAFSVDANSGPERTASIIIGGQTFSVTQAAAAAACTYSLNPSSHDSTAAGGSSAFSVTTTAACSWTSSGVPAWITGIPANGTGPTTINFSVARNSEPAQRTASIIIGGQTLTVTQAATAATCDYSLNPTSHNATAAGGSSVFSVTTTAACSWTTSGVPAWITGIPASGTGPTTINFTVAANSAPAQRTASIVIGGQTFSVTQAAVICSYALNPTSYNAPAEGGTSAFNVNTTAGCRWTTSGVPEWITGIPASGIGPRTINFTVAPITGPPRKNAHIVIEGQTFVVNQRKK